MRALPHATNTPNILQTDYPVRVDRSDVTSASRIIREHMVTISHHRDAARRRGDEGLALGLTWRYDAMHALADRLDHCVIPAKTPLRAVAYLALRALSA
ncbi:hypothetical protein [Humibacter sp.]|uniref:hypothetical protein n=1 Tax=Humibacter sp. TaxID=1940291 RepID=UPI002BE21A07|nr:hypothetical protein [Humibacter sp.]HVX09213.1 hypothetical protein [Humibacter sp.]